VAKLLDLLLRLGAWRALVYLRMLGDSELTNHLVRVAVVVKVVGRLADARALKECWVLLMNAVFMLRNKQDARRVAELALFHFCRESEINRSCTYLTPIDIGFRPHRLTGGPCLVQNSKTVMFSEKTRRPHGAPALFVTTVSCIEQWVTEQE
jgi:hypothetical protein